MPSAVSDLCVLRDTVARIERAGERGEHRGPAEAIPLGDEPLSLDAALGGGLRRGTLHEVMPASARDAAAATGFAVALAARGAGDGAVVWILDDRAAFETGTPYRPGLAAFGLDPAHLLLVRTRDATATLWATEEALRAGARMVLTELWRGQAYDLAASRRLLLAARRRGATSILVHVGLTPDAVSSVADTRFAVAASPGERRPSAGGRTPVPGAAGFAVQLLKLRSAATDGMRGFDPEAVHPLVWDRTTHAFRTVRDHEPLRQRPIGPPPGHPSLQGRSAR